MSLPQVLPRACTSAPPLVELPELNGREPQSCGQVLYRNDRVLIVTRQKHDSVAALDDGISSQDRSTQMIEAFH